MLDLISAPSPSAAPAVSDDLAHCIESATTALLREQRPDGHWVFELEADATIPSEYLLLLHFLGEPQPALEAKMAKYLRRAQGDHGGWPLVHGGAFNLSASVKAYFALKIVGDSPDDPHMQSARSAILRHGGAGASNVFTRFLLALYGIVPWRAVPAMPVEIMLLPRWFPIHISKISYWGRTVLVPLLVLQAIRPVARNPRGVRIDELFDKPIDRLRDCTRAEHQSPGWFAVFRSIDALLKWTQWLFPNGIRRRAISKAVSFITERNREGGLGAIFPAMANSVMMFDALGYSRSHPDLVRARRAIEKLVIEKSGEAYCQPCESPVWDTALTCHALLEVGTASAKRAVRNALAWLKDRQVFDVVGDWADQRPNVRPGGWPFQYENAHYPDLDDTAVVVMAMERASRDFSISAGADYSESIARAREWTLGLQSRNGGWAAFDADNVSDYLNHTPFADHGALLDPPTADVTARCVSMLAYLPGGVDAESVAAALAFLRRAQRHDGSWFGRWGMNYIYGTWSVLCAMNIAGLGPHATEVRRAVEWLRAVQNDDGGWGESIQSYELGYDGYEPAPSTASQTAWALLGLMAAGEWSDDAVDRGIRYLMRTQDSDGFWAEPQFTATGFPRVFYLRYHGYAKLFPLWALARYQTLRDHSLRMPRFGM
ncbi:MAG: squalene--hopene cyclase [Burkholderiaceae bacterium]